ncbi:MAG: TolC family protein [Pseudomonadota bacterium]|nr:TolC family protein [Pseudomonadota bacterium]
MIASPCLSKPAVAGTFSRLRRMALFAVLVAGLLAEVAAQSPLEPLGLMEAVELAERDAPMIAARQAAADAAQHLVGPAGERPDPELIIGVDNLPVSSDDAFNLNRDFMTMRRIGVMQAFPRRAKRQLRVQRAEAESTREQAMLIAEQLATREAVAIAWIACASAERRLQLATALRAQADALVGAATAAIGSGRGTAADAIAAQQARFALEDRIQALQLERDQAHITLAQWLPDTAARPLGGAPDFTDLGADFEGLRTRLDHHRELLSYDAITQVAQVEIALAQAEKQPDWSLELAYADRGPAYSNMVSLQFRIGLPLFAARRQDPTIAARAATLRQIESERTAAERTHRSEIERTHATWRTALQRVRRYERDLLPLGDDRAQAALAAYRGGAGQLHSVLIAIDAAVEQRMAYIDVLDSLGQSWAALHFAFAKER